MDFDENQAARLLFDNFSAENIKIWKKIDFLEFLSICTCKVEKNPQIFSADFEVFL